MRSLPIVVVLLFMMTEAWSLTPPERELAKKSDAYLQSVESLELLKSSECGYALAKRDFPILDKVWAAEILPAFQPKARDELASLWPQIKEKIINAAKKSASDLSHEFGVDKNTGCGIQAGLSICLYDNFQEQWLEAKKQYSFVQ